MIQQDLKAIDDFVTSHWHYFAGTAFAIFSVGTVLGRFVFDRALATTKAELELAKAERDAAKRNATDLKTELESAQAKKLAIQAEKESSFRRASGRLVSAATMILLLALVGYNVYIESRTIQIISDFKTDTASSLQTLKPVIVTKLVAKPCPCKPTTKTPRVPPPAASDSQ